jgi:hypothetical protein
MNGELEVFVILEVLKVRDIFGIAESLACKASGLRRPRLAGYTICTVTFTCNLMWHNLDRFHSPSSSQHRTAELGHSKHRTTDLRYGVNPILAKPCWWEPLRR